MIACIKEILKELNFETQVEWINSLLNRNTINSNEWDELYNHFKNIKLSKKEDIYKSICSIPLKYRKDKLNKLLLNGDISPIDYTVLIRQAMTNCVSDLSYCLKDISNRTEDLDFTRLVSILALEDRITEFEFQDLMKWNDKKDKNKSIKLD